MGQSKKAGGNAFEQKLIGLSPLNYSFDSRANAVGSVFTMAQPLNKPMEFFT